MKSQNSERPTRSAVWGRRAGLNRCIAVLQAAGKFSWSLWLLWFIWFVWFLWFLWSIWLVWFNQINETDETDQTTIFGCGLTSFYWELFHEFFGKERGLEHPTHAG